MEVEIERKFLVDKQKWNKAAKGQGQAYRQGYLLTEPGKTIRVRLTENQAFLTIKGPSTGVSRPEFEYAIPPEDAEALLDTFCKAVISKTRYKLYFAGKLWEVDEFSGDNAGLIIAEIELKTDDELFDLPSWIDREVTSDERYYNARLSLHPYKNW